MKRPNALDWVVYRIFRWWWNPILARKPLMAWGLAYEIKNWLEARRDRRQEPSDAIPETTVLVVSAGADAPDRVS